MVLGCHGFQTRAKLCNVWCYFTFDVLPAPFQVIYIACRRSLSKQRASRSQCAAAAPSPTMAALSGDAEQPYMAAEGLLPGLCSLLPPAAASEPPQRAG